MSSTPEPRQFYDDEQGSTAYGIAVFAGVLLATLGCFQILQGLSAVLKDDVFVKGLEYTYKIDLTTWGWIAMLLGAIGIAVGVGIIKSQVWASSAGIGFAVLSALGQFAFMPYYPFWAMAIITLDILVIWALCKQIARA
jgi:hypothetical protein